MVGFTGFCQVLAAGAVVAFVATAGGRTFTAAFCFCRVAICEPDGEVRTVASSASNSAMRFWAAIKSDLLANMLDVFCLFDEFIFWFVVVIGLVFMA